MPVHLLEFASCWSGGDLDNRVVDLETKDKLIPCFPQNREMEVLVGRNG